MANWWDNEHYNNDGGKCVHNTVITRAEFLDFRDKNQQFHDLTQLILDRIQEALATLLT